MDDFGNHLLAGYEPSVENKHLPLVFNWTGMVYFYYPELASVQWF